MTGDADAKVAIVLAIIHAVKEKRILLRFDTWANHVFSSRTEILYLYRNDRRHST